MHTVHAAKSAPIAAKIVSRVFSASSAPAASFDKKISSLEGQIAGLNGALHRIENWLLFFTGVVIVGLALESWGDVRLFWSLRRQERSGLAWPVHGETSGKVLMTLAGAILIVIGVSGELVEERFADVTDTKLGIDNGAVTALLTEKADAAEGRIADANIKAQAAIDTGTALKKLNEGLVNEVSAQEGAIKSADEQLASLTGHEASVKSKLGDFESRAAQAEDRLERTTADEQELIYEAGPRTISTFGLKNALPNSSKPPIFLTSLPDSEPKEFADNLAQALVLAGFKVTRLHASGKRLFPGIMIEAGTESGTIIPREDDWDAARAIEYALTTLEGLKASVHEEQRDNFFWEPCVPVNALLIRVQEIPKDLAMQKRIEAERARNPRASIFLNNGGTGRISDDEACPKTGK